MKRVLYNPTKLHHAINALLESVNLLHLGDSWFNQVDSRIQLTEGSITSRPFIEMMIEEVLPPSLSTRYFVYKQNRDFLKGFQTLQEIATFFEIELDPDVDASTKVFPKHKDLMIFLQSSSHIEGLYFMRTLLKYAEINNLSLHNYKEWSTADHHLLSIFSFEGLELLHRRYLITHADYSLETVIEFLTRIYGTVDENFKFTHIFSTPIMRNNGHLGPEYTAACAMIEVGDSMVDIFEAAKEVANCTIHNAGIGLNLSRLRPNQSPVGNKFLGLKTLGLPPVINMFRSVVNLLNQPQRGSAVTYYLPVVHPDIEAYLNLRYRVSVDGQLGPREHMCVVMTGDFMEAAKDKTAYTLRWSDDYLNHKNYVGGNFYGRMSADDVLSKIATLILSTGEPFILFRDNANDFVPNKVTTNPINFGNLCTEFFVPHSSHKPGKPDPTSFCFLGSIVLPSMMTAQGYIDFNLLEETIKKTFSKLKTLSINFSRQTNTLYPVGVGLCGFWDAYFVSNEMYTRSTFTIAVFEFIHRVLRDNYPDHFFNFMVAPTSSASRIANVLPGIDPPWGVVEETVTNDGRFTKPNPLSKSEKFFTVDELSLEEQIALMAIRERYVNGASNTLYLKTEDQTVERVKWAIMECWLKGIKSLYYWRLKTVVDEDLFDDPLCTGGACEV